MINFRFPGESRDQIAHRFRSSFRCNPMETRRFVDVDKILSESFQKFVVDLFDVDFGCRGNLLVVFVGRVEFLGVTSFPSEIHRRRVFHGEFRRMRKLFEMCEFLRRFRRGNLLVIVEFVFFRLSNGCLLNRRLQRTSSSIFR